MTVKSKGLKKGTLEFLLSSTGLENNSLLDDSDNATNGQLNTDDSSASSSTNKTKANNSVNVIAIEKIERSPYQPRKVFSEESLSELASSIKAKGLIQPLVVRYLEQPDKYELIAGERRWRACQLAGLHEVPVVIKNVDNETALVMAIVENIQREDLSALEEAQGFKRLIDEFALTQQQVAEVVGKSRTTVTNLLRLLSLNQGVQQYLAENKLEMGHARALLSLDKEQQLKVANRIIMKKASVRDAEKWVREILSPSTGMVKSEYIDDPNIKSLENTLSEKLSADVLVQHSGSGKGKLVINYFSLDELEGIIAKIK